MIGDISFRVRFLVIFIIYLSTIYGFTNHIILFTIPIVLVSHSKIIFLKSEQMSLALLFFMSVLSIINNYIYIINVGETPSLPYIPAIVISFFLVKFINHDMLKIVLIFIFIELMFAGYEYSLGVSSIFKNNPNYFEFSREALYYRKVSGLSGSSSVLSYKFLVGLFIVRLLNVGNALKLLLYFMLSCGIIFSFNRTVVLTGVMFFIIVFVSYLVSKKKEIISLFSLLYLIFIVSAFFIPKIINYLIVQFSRGDVSHGVDLSSRTYIWNKYLDIISSNFFFGTGSYKEFVTISVKGYYNHPFHAHNSILMMLSSHGLIISLLLLVFVLINVNRENFIYIFLFFVYSMTQYGIFWGVSFLDVFFLFFLLSEKLIRKPIPIHLICDKS